MFGRPDGGPPADATTEPTTEAGDPSEARAEREPDWWHRDHPTFTALTGFFTGLAFVILVPGVFGLVLGAVLDEKTAEDLFPFVLVTLVVPLGLLAVPRTRRFGGYMLIGMVVTLLVVGGVTAAVLWYMINYDS